MATKSIGVRLEDDELLMLYTLSIRTGETPGTCARSADRGSQGSTSDFWDRSGRRCTAWAG